MQATLDELGIELLKYGYRKVVFLEVECKIDGAFRLGISAEQPIGDRLECPRCHLPRPRSGILATGYSRRPLPLEPELWKAAIDWDTISDDDYRPPANKPGLEGRARHYRKKLQVVTVAV